MSSGAYFGVRGRLVASAIGLLLCLGYIALTVWTGGEAVVTAIARVMGTEATDGNVALRDVADQLQARGVSPDGPSEPEPEVQQPADPAR